MNARVYLDTVQARANAATEGPWHRSTVHFRDKLSTSVKDESAKVIAHTGYPEDINDEPAKNAAFIAHAREDVPRLVAALQAVLDLCEQARTMPRVSTYSNGVANTHRLIESTVERALAGESGE